MRIAVLSVIPLYPTIEGSRRRTLNLVHALADFGHEVHFVQMTVGPEIVDRQAYADDPRIASYTELVRYPLPTFIYWAQRAVRTRLRRLKKWLGVPNHQRLRLDEYFYPEQLPQLRALFDRLRPDAVLLEYVFNSRALEACAPGTLRVIDTHDAFADRHLQFPKDATVADYWYSVSPEEEARGMRRADVVIAIQDEEAEEFRRQLGAPPPRVVTVSHIATFEERVTDFTPLGAVFLGGKSIPNVDALRFLIDDILPRILAELPDFRLYIAGTIAGQAPDHPAIVKLGRVDRVIDAFRVAPIALNPMLIGTGIAIKVLDAMTSGVVTVATRAGARGISAEFAGGLAVVDDGDAAAFAAEVVRFARSEQERRAGGERAFAAAQAWNARQLAGLATIFPPATPAVAAADRPEAHAASLA
ncbi:glycosyltransferase [Ancylobacter terrae]|uniref:glycosyltransferase n=1 Tax=Ancylobacter sp. sgz301288 TaxID=3342077 RepID=UPI00386007E2